MRYAIAILLFIALPVFGAEQIDTTGLSEEAIAQLELAAAQARADAVSGAGDVLADLSVEDVERFSEIGTVISTTITETASGLGMAANEFLATDAGTLVAGVVVWHFAGEQIMEIAYDIVKTLFGIFVVLPILLYMHRRYVFNIKTNGFTYTEDGKERPIWKEALSEEDEGTSTCPRS